VVRPAEPLVTKLVVDRAGGAGVDKPLAGAGGAGVDKPLAGADPAVVKPLAGAGGAVVKPLAGAGGAGADKPLAGAGAAVVKPLESAVTRAVGAGPCRVLHRVRLFNWYLGKAVYEDLLDDIIVSGDPRRFYVAGDEFAHGKCYTFVKRFFDTVPRWDAATRTLRTTVMHKDGRVGELVFDLLLRDMEPHATLRKRSTLILEALQIR
jgi:hypothetical protein